MIMDGRSGNTNERNTNAWCHTILVLKKIDSNGNGCSHSHSDSSNFITVPELGSLCL